MAGAFRGLIELVGVWLGAPDTAVHPGCVNVYDGLAATLTTYDGATATLTAYDGLAATCITWDTPCD